MVSFKKQKKYSERELDYLGGRDKKSSRENWDSNSIRQMAVILPVIALFIAGIFVVRDLIIPSVKYSEAMDYLEEGKYREAYDILEIYDDFKDTKEKRAEMKFQVLPQSSAGDTINLGNYNGNTEWKVLERVDDKILVISKYALDYKMYNEEKADISWEESSLRTWLNGEYLNMTFSDAEIERIIEAEVTNAPNQQYGTDAGNDTRDRIFLLSDAEAEKYFASDEERIATLSDGTMVWWWLRTTGIKKSRAMGVNSSGTVYYNGNFTYDNGGAAVRPAMWIDLSIQ